MCVCVCVCARAHAHEGKIARWEKSGSNALRRRRVPAREKHGRQRCWPRTTASRLHMAATALRGKTETVPGTGAGTRPCVTKCGLPTPLGPGAASLGMASMCDVSSVPPGAWFTHTHTYTHTHTHRCYVHTHTHTHTYTHTHMCTQVLCKRDVQAG